MTRWTIIFLLFLTGCIVKFPLYTDKDLVDAPDLIGEWQAMTLDTANIWTIKKQKDKDYIITEIYNTELTTYSAKFLKLNGQLFADLQYLDNETHKLKDEGHMIFKILTDNSTVKALIFDSDYLVKLAKQNKIQLQYETSYDKSSDYNTGVSYVITEPTDKLQKLIIDYMNDQNVFSDKDAMTFKRKTK